MGNSNSCFPSPWRPQFHHFDGAGGQCSFSIFSAFWQGARICHNGPQAWIKISGKHSNMCTLWSYKHTHIHMIYCTMIDYTYCNDIHILLYICIYINIIKYTHTCELFAISGSWHSPIAIIRSVYRCLFFEGNDLCLGGHEVSAQYLRPARCCVGKRKQLRLQNLMVDQELITIYAIKSCHSMGISFVSQCVTHAQLRGTAMRGEQVFPHALDANQFGESDRTVNLIVERVRRKTCKSCSCT